MKSMPLFSFLQLGLIALTVFIVSACQCELQLTDKVGQQIENNAVLIQSSELLYALKEGIDYTSIVKEMQEISMEALQSALAADEQKMIFWINLYNAWIQMELMKDPDQYNKKERFFSNKRIEIAGLHLSFDDIEHGILRGNEWKYGFGHLKNPFSSKNLKTLAVSSKDARLHFALNCGARSCPPIAIYTAENYHDLLEHVSEQFLKMSCQYNANTGELWVTPLFSWFRGDFCNEIGIRRTLDHYGVMPIDQEVKLQYADYNWDLELGNYHDE